MRRALLAALAVMFSGVGAAAALPSGVRVSPVVVAFPAASGVSSLRIDNGRTTAASFQIDVYRWTQVDGADVLVATADLAVAPSIFEVPAGAGRIVRLALAPAARAATREQAFRLIARELPSGPAPAGRSRLVLELSLPVFATVRGAAPLVVAYRDGAATAIANAGDAHMRVLAVKAGARNGVAPNVPRYLLAGSVLRRPLPADVSADALRVLFIPVGAHEPVEQTVRIAADSAGLDARSH